MDGNTKGQGQKVYVCTRFMCPMSHAFEPVPGRRKQSCPKLSSVRLGGVAAGIYSCFRACADV